MKIYKYKNWWNTCTLPLLPEEFKKSYHFASKLPFWQSSNIFFQPQPEIVLPPPKQNPRCAAVSCFLYRYVFTGFQMSNIFPDKPIYSWFNTSNLIQNIGNIKSFLKNIRLTILTNLLRCNWPDYKINLSCLNVLRNRTI